MEVTKSGKIKICRQIFDKLIFIFLSILLSKKIVKILSVLIDIITIITLFNCLYVYTRRHVWILPPDTCESESLYSLSSISNSFLSTAHIQLYCPCSLSTIWFVDPGNILWQSTWILITHEMISSSTLPVTVLIVQVACIILQIGDNTDCWNIYSRTHIFG